MHKIASPDELVAELRRLLAYSQTEKPSRVRLATEMRELAGRVAQQGLRGSYSRVLTAGEEISSLPPGTKLVGDNYGDHFSSWGGKLALVTYASPKSSLLTEHDFDVVGLRRNYSVFFALPEVGNEPYDARPEWLGRKPELRDGSKPYAQSTFKLQTFGSMDKGITNGRFSKLQEYWLRLKFKDLTPAETSYYTKHLVSSGYIDASMERELGGKDWLAIFKMKSSDEITSSLDANKENALYRVLGRPDDYFDAIAKIKGVFAQTKQGGFKYIIPR